jgi:hypothetical protein
MPVITLPKDVGEMSDGFSSLGEGTYEATIERVNVGQTQKGNTKMDIMWKNEGEGGGVVWDTVAVNVDFKVKQYARLLGMDSGDTLDTDLLVGAKGIIEIASDSYTNPSTGETTVRGKIKRVSPVA